MILCLLANKVKKCLSVLGLFFYQKSTHEIQIPEDAFVVLQVCAPGGRTEPHAAAQVIT